MREEEVASGWTRASLGEVATITLGGTPSTEVPTFWGGSVPWMASGDVHLRIVDDVPGRITQLGLRLSNATLVEPPVVAIALAGQGKTRGTVAFVRVPVSTNQSIAMLAGVGALDTKYLFHDFDRRYEELRGRSSGGGRGGLSRRVLAEIPIKLPPLPEQRQIAAILDTIDDAIRKTEQIIAKLKRAKQGLLHDLLTRGIDDNGELRDPERHPEQFTDSPLGRIPTGWRVEPLERMLARVIDYRGRTPTKTTSGIPLLTAKNVKDGYVDPEPREYIASDAYDRWMTRGIPSPGDVLFTTEAPLGNVAAIPSGQIALAQRVITLVPSPELLDHAF